MTTRDFARRSYFRFKWTNLLQGVRKYAEAIMCLATSERSLLYIVKLHLQGRTSSVPLALGHLVVLVQTLTSGLLVVFTHVWRTTTRTSGLYRVQGRSLGDQVDQSRSRWSRPLIKKVPIFPLNACPGQRGNNFQKFHQAHPITAFEEILPQRLIPVLVPALLTDHSQELA